MVTCFNSMKVRLERPAIDLSSTGETPFQFHEGTIRTGQEGVPGASVQVSIP